MAINIPILSSLNADGFEKAAREFKALKKLIIKALLGVVTVFLFVLMAEKIPDI